MRPYLSLLIVWLSWTLCHSEEQNPSFPRRRANNLEVIKNQYIVQYKDSKDFNNAKQNATAFNATDAQIVKYIDSRNIGTIKFSSEEKAMKWLEDNAQGLKYFEEGE